MGKLISEVCTRRMKCGLWSMLTNCISITVTLNHQALRQCLTRRKTHSMGQHYNQQGRKGQRSDGSKLMGDKA